MTVTKLLKAVRRYVALHTYEGRQGWRHFKEEATELWQYQCFRFQHWFGQIWRFRSLAWLVSLRAPRDKSFGRFGGNEKMVALMKHVHRSDKFKFENVCKSVGDAMANADVYIEREHKELLEQARRKAREDRIGNIVILGAVAVILVAFITAVAAIFFMK